MVGRVFSGISLGSILLLAALGLAITYGLMGVINMAHGELIMIGAYTTYVVQNLFRAHLPGAFDAYLIAAVPAAFVVSALVGMVLERSVIRFLYGRPLETLLATWGISLILMQAVRTIFGAQNVQVENPSWMSGGIEAISQRRAAVEPHRDHRLRDAGAGADVAAADAHAARPVRARRDAEPADGELRSACRRARVDTWAFGLGSGIAGLAGCALSQIGNVGPDLGQSYIVDSFMVVVLGGVGQLAGTVYAALGLGVVNKFLEGVVGRGAREDRGAGLHHRLHPEAAAGPVRAEGPEGRGVMRSSAALRRRHAERRSAAAAPVIIDADRASRACCRPRAGRATSASR